MKKTKNANVSSKVKETMMSKNLTTMTAAVMKIPAMTKMT